MVFKRVEDMRRVVVTGMGLVTPLGRGLESNLKGIMAGKSVVSRITSFDTTDFSVKIGGFVPKGKEKGQFNIDSVVSPKEQRHMDEFIAYGITAATDAVEDSGWIASTDEDKERTGVLIGSGIGGLTTIAQAVPLLEEGGPRRVSPFFIPACLINLASGHVSIKYGFQGPNHSVVTACATGTHAIGDAARMIKYGDADVMVAGGAESAICPLGVAGFSQARALSTHYNDSPDKASRPWDKGRDGFVMGEGSGVVVLEEYEHAKKRGARIYGEVVGYGMSGDAYHITSPGNNGGFRAMSAALKSAGLTPQDVDYINAHGTSTPVGDMIELNAVKELFKDTKVAMSSTKSIIGHLLGAAGAVEAIYSLMAMNYNMLPPTANLENPEDAAESIDLVPLVAKEKQVNIALSNSFGFGGTNASLIFKKI